MNFILEKNNNAMETESFLWKQLLRDARQHKYIEATLHDVSLPHILHATSDPIPLGSIDFTNQCLNHFYNIPQMNPVEIPPCLRTPEFLGREYKIVHANELPNSGTHFIKDASAMKRFSFCGDMQNFHFHDDINPNDMYVVSEVLDILTEYRVYFVHGKIYAIEYYNGNPSVLPNVSQIHKANIIYSMQPNYPMSYTMDWMVTKSGTFLIEIHPTLFSVGLYTTLLGDGFLDGYKESLDYILRHNTPVIPS